MVRKSFKAMLAWEFLKMSLRKLRGKVLGFGA